MPKRSKWFLYRLFEILGPWIIRLLRLTLRVERVNFEPVQKLLQGGKPLLWCLWHGRMYLPMLEHSKRGIAVMISLHADGEMIARVAKKLGYRTVRGSSTRGGKEAFYEMLDYLNGGCQGAMLPDGPTGPRHYFKPGTLFLAQRSQAYLIPITFAAKPCWRFHSWDRFVLPKPFAHCALYYGTPIQIPEVIPQAEVEAWRLKLEQMMIELVNAAETHLGYEHKEP
ncbi:MAG: lysophospholipid acyltransferase family protein [bacterium]